MDDNFKKIIKLLKIITKRAFYKRSLKEINLNKLIILVKVFPTSSWLSKWLTISLGLHEAAWFKYLKALQSIILWLS